MAQQLFLVLYRDNPGAEIVPEIVTILPAGQTVATEDIYTQQDDELTRTDVYSLYSTFLNFDLHSDILPTELQDMRDQIEDATTIAALRTATLRWYDYTHPDLTIGGGE